MGIILGINMISQGMKRNEMDRPMFNRSMLYVVSSEMVQQISDFKDVSLSLSLEKNEKCEKRQNARNNQKEP